MKFIIGGRGSGVTTDILLEASKFDRPIIVPTTVQLHKGDIFTISTTKLAYCLLTNQINMDCFKVVHVYSKRLIPKRWYRKLMFWRWIKMVDLVDVEFTGNN